MRRNPPLELLLTKVSGQDVDRHLKQQLQLVQNTAAKIVTQTPRSSSHIALVLQSLHWLPIEARIQHKVAFMTYKVRHDETHCYVSSMLKH